MKQPRDYQQKIIDEARVKLRSLRQSGRKRAPRLLIQAPCGAGKTVINAFMTASARQKEATVMFLCHRDFLVDQTSKTYEANRIEHSFIAQGRWFNPYSPVSIGTIGMVRNRLDRIRPPTICFIDECHHIAAKTWAQIMDAWPETTFIGLSATPARTDGQGLDAYFDDMILGPSVASLIGIGALSDYKYYSPSSPDLTGTHTRMGDYVTAETDAEMQKSVVIGNIVEHYRKLAMDTRAVYFATTIKTSQLYADAFNANGIPAMHLDADSSSFERRKAAMDFADGTLKVLTNVGLFGEGYDLSAQAGRDVTIETVGLARPTKSLILYIQQSMRCMRAKTYPGIILDHAGCLAEHGLPDDEFEWTLKGTDKKPLAAVMHCDGCGAAMPRNTAVCRHCGFVNGEDMLGKPKAAPRQVEHKDGDLQEVDKDAVRLSKKMEEWNCVTVMDFLALAKKRGYSNPEGWAGLMFTAKARTEKQKADKRINGQINFFENLGR